MQGFSLPPIRWDTIQNVFYRKDEVYTMDWKIPDLSDYLVAVSKNGGPIGKSLIISLGGASTELTRVQH